MPFYDSNNERLKLQFIQVLNLLFPLYIMNKNLRFVTNGWPTWSTSWQKRISNIVYPLKKINKYYNLWAMVIFIIQQYPQTSSAATLMKSLDFGSQIAGMVITHCISVSTKIGWTFSRWSAWISSVLRKRILCAKISKARYEFPWSSLIVVFLFKTYICTKDWI